MAAWLCRPVLLALAVLMGALAAPTCDAQQCPLTGCCDLLATNGNPLPGQTVTFILRGGVTTPNPFICQWYGIGAMRGTITGSAGAAPLPAATISGLANIGYFGANVGSVGTVLTSPLRINALNVTRACNFGSYGSIFGGCPLNNSAQDIHRFFFTVPANAIAGTVYTFCFTGNVYGITSWSGPFGGWYCPVIGAALPLPNCCVSIVVGATGPPSNDSACACATIGLGNTVGTTIGATPDGSSTCDGGGNPDVWYCFTPSCAGLVTATTCGSAGNPDTVLSIHTGPCTSPTEIACNDDDFGILCPGTVKSTVQFNATCGTTYRIRVAGFGGTGSLFTLTLSQAAPPPPTNDNPCPGSIALTGNVTNFPFSTCGATTTTNVPGACSVVNNDIWYTYTATCTGVVSMSTIGSCFNTAMAVYTTQTPACNPVCLLACNDDNGPAGVSTSASVQFPASAGTPYLVRIGGNAPGVVGCCGVLTISCSPTQPNNLCTGAIAVGLGTYSGSTLGATPSPLTGMCGASNNSPDVWYAFTAPCTYGAVTIDTCTAPCSRQYDTVLSVHSQCPTPTSTYTIACNDDACGATGLLSRIVFTPIPCQPYLIRVSGFAGLTGNFILNIAQASAAPPNNNCATATVLLNTVSSVPFSNCGATNDGPNTCAPIGKDIWFKWTAPCNGPVTIHTFGSAFDTVLAVYPAAVCPPTQASQIACNDDFGSTLQSQVTFTATTGTMYLIRIGGYNYSSGVSMGCGRLTIIGNNVACQSCALIPPTAPFSAGRTFMVIGTADGSNWKWRISQNCCFCIENCNVPGLPSGSTAVQLANAFVASITSTVSSAGCTGKIVATQIITAGNVQTNVFTIKARQCSPNFPPYVFEIGDTADACNALCTVANVVGPDPLPTTGPCNFNPPLIELPTSGLDCNNNGIDDLAEIAAGIAFDLNGDGIPDECGCPCEWNHDGVLNSQDFFDFLSAFFTGNADFNLDGITNSQDFFDFVSCFFNPPAGCN